MLPHLKLKFSYCHIGNTILECSKTLTYSPIYNKMGVWLVEGVRDPWAKPGPSLNQHNPTDGTKVDLVWWRAKTQHVGRSACMVHCNGTTSYLNSWWQWERFTPAGKVIYEMLHYLIYDSAYHTCMTWLCRVGPRSLSLISMLYDKTRVLCGIGPRIPLKGFPIAWLEVWLCPPAGCLPFLRDS